MSLITTAVTSCFTIYFSFIILVILFVLLAFSCDGVFLYFWWCIFELFLFSIFISQSNHPSSFFQERLYWFLYNFCRFFYIALVVSNLHKIVHSCHSLWELFCGYFLPFRGQIVYKYIQMLLVHIPVKVTAFKKVFCSMVPLSRGPLWGMDPCFLTCSAISWKLFDLLSCSFVQILLLLWYHYYCTL